MEVKPFLFWNTWFWSARVEISAVIKRRAISSRKNLGSIYSGWAYRSNGPETAKAAPLFWQLSLVTAKCYLGGTGFKDMKGSWKAAEICPSLEGLKFLRRGHERPFVKLWPQLQVETPGLKGSWTEYLTQFDRVRVLEESPRWSYWLSAAQLLWRPQYFGAGSTMDNLQGQQHVQCGTSLWDKLCAACQWQSWRNGIFWGPENSEWVQDVKHKTHFSFVHIHITGSHLKQWRTFFLTVKLEFCFHLIMSKPWLFLRKDMQLTSWFYRAHS